MTEEFISMLLNDFGFPAFICAVLLWDKMKTNGSMKKVVENNNELLKEIKIKLCSQKEL